MKGVNLIILRYLYENDTGEFLDTTKAFDAEKIPSRKHIENTFESLEKFIETESVYNYRGIITLDEPVPKTPLLKARIKQEGREFYFNYINSTDLLRIKKKRLYIAGFVAFLTLITAFITFLMPYFKESNEPVISESDFPNPILCLSNESKDTIYFYARQDFIIWFPETVYGDAPNSTGKYEFVYDSTRIKNGLIFIAPETEYRISINIENRQKFYRYFIANENEIMLWLRTSEGNRLSSTPLPFNKKWISKYCTDITIKEVKSKEDS